MKKLTLMMIAIICSLWHFQTLAVSVKTEITLQDERPDKGIQPDKGHRIPSAPVICTIDFENHRIETSIPYEIIAYELWDEDGIDTIVSYPSDYDIVEFMSTVSGAFQLRLITVEHTYIGYLEL